MIQTIHGLAACLEQARRMRVKLPIYYVLKGREQRLPYHTQQSLRIGAVISKLGTVTGWGWEGDRFVVHVA